MNPGQDTFPLQIKETEEKEKNTDGRCEDKWPLQTTCYKKQKQTKKQQELIMETKYPCWPIHSPSLLSSGMKLWAEAWKIRVNCKRGAKGGREKGRGQWEQQRSGDQEPEDEDDADPQKDLGQELLLCLLRWPRGCWKIKQNRATQDPCHLGFSLR